ncbi:kinase non-catalytic C-lobe domain-containing protein 1 [Sylvia atricapilla]|uniref:kinase non-catalytic C-lobe domain-containing protein 1 n=1 Tax=Sylvia atricapilla TaxID=48155 RepID=UPI00339AB080
METLGAAEDVFYEEEEEEVNCYDFEPLPTLLEDEENVSLADILSLRESCLTEQDIWAICLECCHSLKSIAHSAIFQTLCITPDTLAFNTNGNVCFMEQLSDDPEGAFVPPEFDITGNTFEAHIYSLGATLKAAIEYIVEPETESEFGQDLHTLLEQMQEENPENRPDIESILSLCEEKMKIASSSNICRSLSAVGRRVLSIESFGASQDVCDNMWKGRMCQRSLGSKLYSNEKSSIAGDSSAVEEVTTACHNNSSVVAMVTGRESGLKEMQIDLDNEKTQHSQLATQTEKSKEEDKHTVYSDSFASIALDIKSCVIDLERDGLFKKGSLRKMKTFPKLPLELADTNNFFTSVTNSGPTADRKNHFVTQESLPLDNNNEVAFSKGNLNSFAVSSPPEIESQNHQVDDRRLQAPCVCTQVSGLNLGEHMSLISGKKIGFSSSDHREDSSGATFEVLKPADMLKSPNQSIAGAKMLDNYLLLEDCSETLQGSNENYVPHFNKMDSVLTTKPSGNRHGSNLIRPPELSNGVMSANNNEDNLCGGRGSEIKSNEQWISLKLLLSWYGRPLKDFELWALCHECLCTLQTCIDYPVVLCLDSVLIDCHGTILFAAPKAEESCDVFYLAPEIEEEDVDTEKVCVYGVAAVLWMAAKYSVPPSHKLVLPRRLKKLLLDMARKNPKERPSLTAAIKTCNHNLLEQGINSKNILILLGKPIFKAIEEEVVSQDHVTFAFKNEKCVMDPSASSLGFVPFTSESKLIAVKGPVPCQISPNCEKATLPLAFTSPATHFKPIILQQDANITKEVHTPVSDQFKKEPRKEKYMNHNKSGYREDCKSCGIEDTGGVETAPETPECDLQVSGHSFQMSSEEQNSGNMFPSPVILPSPSDSSHILQEKSVLSEDPSSSLACPTSPNFLHINNIILKQDSEKRVLTFVPVHLAVSEQIPNKPLRSRIAYDCYHSLPVLLSSTIASYKMSMQAENDASLCTVQSHETTNVENRFGKCSPDIQTNCQETECATSTDGFFTEQEHTPCTAVDKDSYHFCHDKVLPHQSTTSDALLQEVIHLIQEEFAFDGYLENGAEVFDMGNFILNLKEIKFGMFSDRICQKFCDLYWDEKLLENLYQVINGGRSSHLCITEADEAKCNNIFQDVKKSENFLASSGQTEGKGEANFDVKAEPMTKTSLVEMDFDEPPLDNIKKELTLQNTIPTAKEQQYFQSNICGPGFEEENTSSEEQAMIKVTGKSYLASPNLPDFCSCSPGWSSAFYGAECFDSEVHSYLKNLGKQKPSESQNIDAKKVELEQLLMMETKNYKKTIKFYQKLLQKERRGKGLETKSMLPKLRGQLQEMKSKVQFLELVKKYVQMMYAEQWGVESHVLPTVIHSGKADTMAPMNGSSLLLYYNTEKHQCNNQNGVRVLQAGTPLGLMAYLYSRNAFLEGYVQQFLYTFRYFCTQEEFLQFLLDRISSTLSSASLDPSTSLTKICNRSFYILQAWIEDCYSVDFATNTNLLGTLKEFISSKVASLNGYGERLLSLLEDASARKSGSADLCSGVGKCEEESEESRKTLHSLCKKLSEDVSRKNFYWRLSKGVGPITQYQREWLHTGSAVLPKPCCSSFTEESSVSVARADEVGPVLLMECSAQQLCWQLTLLQQEVFNKCHPVHFLNSRALGVKDKCVAVPKAVSAETVSLKVCNLFLSKCIQDQYLLQLLKNADSISTWVAAEIVTCHTTKRQVSLLSKFLLIAKCCYEQRNFATAMQILTGLENLIVRQLPAWKILPAKVAEIMEELKAVEVFLKSDSLCLMEGDRFKTLPTIPSAHVLAMHVQQLETGGFTMTNGAHKWTKLRNIAKVVSQVHAFQENPYTYAPDFKLQSYLRQRITRFKDADISALAADNCANFHQIPAEKHSRKIQDTLRKMKATFQ